MVLPLAFLAGALLGCEDAAAHRASSAALARSELTSTRAEPPSVPRAEPPAIELDRRPDGALLAGTPLPTRPNADPERVLVLQATGAEPGLAGARVVDARFLGSGVVTLGVDHVLRLHRQGEVTVLDTGAYEPLSVSGTLVAYVRGAPPSLEVALADGATGTRTQLTEQLAPCWSPTISPDGAAIVFISGASGSPRLYRVEPGGAPRLLAQVKRFPSAPVEPRFEDGLYVFDDELGTAWVDSHTGRVVRATERAR